MEHYDQNEQRDYAKDENDGTLSDKSPQPITPTAQEAPSERVKAAVEPTPDDNPAAAPEPADAPASAAEPQLDALAVVEELIGPTAVLLPIPTKKKSPLLSAWQKTKLEDTRTAEYRNRLRTGNIGVLLGLPSGGLCAIDIDHDTGIEPFLALNPALRGSLRTHGARGEQIWVKIQGEYPALKAIKTTDGKDWGEWRATGGQSVISGIHPDGMAYQFVMQAKPVEMKFGEIKWPEALGTPFALSSPEFTELTKLYGSPFEFSKQGAVKINQQWFGRKYLLEHTVVFESSQKEFFEYDPEDGLWKRRTEDRVKNQFLNDLTDAAHQFGVPQLFMKLNDGLTSSLAKMMRGMIEKPNVFDGRKPNIHVKNGVLRFDKDPPELVSFAPEFFSRNMCPLAYDPNADCPRFKKELLESALDPDDVVLMQKWAGSCLMGVNAAQRFLMLRGTPGGGKSTVMNVIEQVLGLQNVALLRTEQLAERFELCAFVGRTLLTGKDVSPTFMMRKGSHVLKALVGGDLLDVEKKGVNERVQIRGNFNVGITSNSTLKVKLEGDAAAWLRRMMIVDYNKARPAKPEPGFAENLIRDEGQGILAWMVDGAQLLLEDLKNYGDYHLTPPQVDRVKQLLAESDSVRQFVEQCVVANPTSSVTSAELVASYAVYCEDQDWEGFDANETARKMPAAMLEVHGAKRHKDIVRNGSFVRGYKGFALVGA